MTFTQNGVSTSVTMSDTVGNGRYFNFAAPLPVCFTTSDPPTGAGSNDIDGDGYCGDDDDPDDNNALYTPSREMSPPDQDQDGFSVWVETYMGIDDTQQCSQSTTPNDESPQAFASDFNDDTFNDISDISLMGPPIFNIVQPAGVNASYAARFDVNADSFVDISDVSLIGPPIFNITTPCTQGDAKQQ